MIHESVSPILRTVQIPGTPHFCLADDRAVTPLCLQTGRLDWDQSFLFIPDIARQLKPGAVVLDVGAFIGDTTHLFLRRGCAVIAVEPQEDAFTLLEHNCPQSINLKRAVGMRGQSIVLTSAVSNTVSSNLGARQVAEHHGLEARPVLALDDLNPYRCDFLKIDVEGFEPFALRGAENFIRRTRPVMHIEINQPALRSQGFSGSSDVYAVVESLNYQISVPQRPERIGTDDPWDILCIPS